MSKNQQYAMKYAEYAMEQMRRYGIPASVTLAQGILESSNGQSRLPGYSDHQTGYVFDVDHYNATEKNGIAFDGTGNDEWFLNNCANYGFIVRYPEDKVDITGYYYEPWHYRYVGIPHAIYMKQNNLCLEEYLDKIKNNTKDNPLTVSAEDGTTWSMWYEKAYEDGDVTQIAIPKDCDYEISGNNVDGFIITVKSK